MPQVDPLTAVRKKVEEHIVHLHMEIARQYVDYQMVGGPGSNRLKDRNEGGIAELERLLKEELR